MTGEWNVWVIGGDARQARLAELLAEDGHRVHTYALELGGELPAATAEESLEGAELADCVVLPLPAEGEEGCLSTPLSARRHPLGEILDALRPGQTVCAGRVSERLAALALERKLTVLDYFAREELAVLNAVPTAEGAVELAMEELPITLHGARVLVIGFGRVGKLCAHRFAALGSQVSVAARKWSDLAWCESLGYGAERIENLRPWLCGYDLVINTVPARVLGEEELKELKSGCLVIDLASKPGGVDLEAAAALGVRVIWALSLPGKTAPVSAGKAIRETIYHMLSE